MAETIEEVIIKIETEGFKEAEKEMESLGEETKKTDKETKEYSKTLKDVGGDVQIFGTSLNGLKGGFTQGLGAIKNSIKGLKTFKIALAGTGIGLIVVALGAMAVAISKSEKAMDALSDAFEVVKTVIDVLIGVVAQLGDSLISLFSGDFEEAFDKATQAFDGLGDRIVDNVNLTLDLEKANRDLEAQLTRNNVQIAKNNLAIAEAKRIADDTTQSIQTRILAGERAQTLIALNAKLEVDTAREALRINTERIESENETNGVLEQTRAQREELAQLEIASIQASQQEQEQLLEITNKVNALRLQAEKELVDKKKALTLTLVTNEEKSTAKIVSFDLDAHNKKLALRQIEFDDAMKKLQDEEDAEKRLSEAKIDFAIGVANDVGSLIFDSASDAKAFNIFISGLEALSAIVKAVNAGPWPANLPAIAFAITATTTTIAKIKASQIPPKKTYALGGVLDGPSHSRGGIHINAEGGEAIINKRSTKLFRRELSAINQAGGGVPFMRLGGVVPTQGSTPSPFDDLERAIVANRPVLVTEDLHQVENGIKVNEAIVTL